MGDVEACVTAEPEGRVRMELAAFYRIVHRHGLTDLIHNHITVRAPGAHDQFLINPFGLDYSEITASNLVKIDLDGALVGPVDGGVRINRAGFLIHSAIHAARPDLACIAHTHTPATVAVASPRLRPAAHQPVGAALRRRPSPTTTTRDRCFARRSAPAWSTASVITTT